MSNTSDQRIAWASIIPSARRSIHDYPDCPIATKVMNQYRNQRYSYVKAGSSKHKLNQTDEGDNEISDALIDDNGYETQYQYSDGSNRSSDQSSSSSSSGNSNLTVICRKLLFSLHSNGSDESRDDVSYETQYSDDDDFICRKLLFSLHSNGSDESRDDVSYETQYSDDDDLNQSIEQSTLLANSNNFSDHSFRTLFHLWQTKPSKPQESTKMVLPLLLIVGCIVTVASMFNTTTVTKPIVYDDESSFYNDIVDLGHKYHIDKDAVFKMKTGISTIVEKQDAGSFMIVYNRYDDHFNAKEFNLFVNDISNTVSKYLRNESTPIYYTLVEGKTLEMYGPSKLISAFHEDLEKTGVMLVKHVEAIPSTLAMAFNLYCHEHNPLVKKSAIFFTLNLAKCSVAEKKPTHAVIKECLAKKWSTVPADSIESLLTRVVSVVIDVTAAAVAAVETNAVPCLPPSPPSTKKSNMWLNGVLSCMSTVLRVFGKADLINEYDEAFYIKPDRIIESSCIGEGAQGKVHLASLKLKNDRPQIVAIKYVQQIDDMTVRHLRNIKHVNIVQTLGVCVNPPKYFIIMEYCSNGSLFDYMRQGIQFSPKQIITWARGIASGMRLLHDKNIIHRDLKSPNILITSDLIAKISDFGTSRTIDGQSKMMSFAGTLNWMAPEVIRAEKYSNKVDVWSFGVVLWELVTLQIPYYKMEQHAIMWGVGTNSVSLPIPPGLPNSIHVLLVQCWNRRHIYRPTFAMVIKSLDLIAEELMIYDQSTFVERQNVWAQEARDSLEMAFLRSEEQYRKRIPAYTKIDLYNRNDLKGKLDALDERMETTNNLFFEICSVRLALERRERELAMKEKLVEGCHCGVRKILKLHREMTSSSDGVPLNLGYRAHLMKPEYQLLVNLINDKPITTATDDPCKCVDKIDHDKIRADKVESKKETVVEVRKMKPDMKPRVKPVYGKRVPRGCAIAQV